MTITTNSNIIAIIPARGGSKGLPGKNLRPLAGKPLIEWTVAAIASAVTPIRCVLTTDDSEIETVAARLGCEVVRRPPELSTDHSPTEPALLHALDQLPNLVPAATVLLLQATSPIRLKGTLDRAISTFFESAADSLVGVVSCSPFVWQGPPTTPRPHYDPANRLRRQDISADKHFYRETGSLYLTSATALRASRNRISGKFELFVMDDLEGLDIDTAEDLVLAERLLEDRVYVA